MERIQRLATRIGFANVHLLGSYTDSQQVVTPQYSLTPKGTSLRRESSQLVEKKLAPQDTSIQLPNTVRSQLFPNLYLLVLVTTFIQHELSWHP